MKKKFLTEAKKPLLAETETKITLDLSTLQELETNVKTGTLNSHMTMITLQPTSQMHTCILTSVGTQTDLQQYGVIHKTLIRDGNIVMN